MARLEGRGANAGVQWFSLAPIRSAESGQDAVDYLFELWPGPDGEVWTRTFSVQGWFTEQDDIWVFARAFAETPALLETRIPINLFRAEGGMPAKLCVSAHWVQVALVGNRSRKWITMTLFVQEGAEPDLFRRFAMRTDVNEAERFGRALEQEVIDACPTWAAKFSPLGSPR